LIRLSPFERKVLKTIRYAVGPEKGMSTEEIARKVFKRKIYCEIKKKICTDFKNQVRAAIHKIRDKLGLYIFNVPFRILQLDLRTGERVLIKRQEYFMPISDDPEETMKYIKDARKRFDKNIKGNERTRRLLEELEMRIKRESIEKIIMEQQEKMKIALKTNR